MKPKQKGNLTELQCIAAFYWNGCHCSIPYGEDCRYDFIADVDNHLIRVQVKTASLNDNNSISFSCRSSRSNSSGCVNRRYTSDEIDYFCTFWDDNCYLIKVTECSATKTLHLGKKDPCLSKTINWAEDYELSSILRKIKSTDK